MTRVRAAVALVSYLASREVQVRHARMNSILPARKDVLPELSLEPASLTQTFQQAVQIGHPYKIVSLWRRLEYQLGQELAEIGQHVLDKPDIEIDTILHAHLDPLAQQLNLTFSQ